jgi:hypothetical protein
VEVEVAAEMGGAALIVAAGAGGACDDVVTVPWGRTTGVGWVCDDVVIVPWGMTAGVGWACDAIVTVSWGMADEAAAAALELAAGVVVGVLVSGATAVGAAGTLEMAIGLAPSVLVPAGSFQGFARPSDTVSADRGKALGLIAVLRCGNSPGTATNPVRPLRAR